MRGFCATWFAEPSRRANGRAPPVSLVKLAGYKEAMNDDQLQAVWNQLLTDLPRYGELPPERRAAIGETLRETELDDVEAVDEFLEVLTSQRPAAADGREHVLAQFLQHSVQPWLLRDTAHALPATAVGRLAEWHRLPESAGLLRFPILRTLAIDAYPPAAATLAELVTTAPPADNRQALMALVPLFQPRVQPPAGAAALFPRLLDAVAMPALAPAVLDLANFFARRGVLNEHPAKARVAELSGLLGALVGRLSRIEEQPQEFAKTPQELSELVNEAVTLIVPLCDALALAGDPAAVGKLRQVLELPHRRLQTEAAAALARLGEEEGRERLMELAKQPVVRSRALHYLEELGAIDKLDAALRTPEARAEGDLAAWMAQPTRFGVAPDTLELIDTTKQFWPGYVDPVTCFLFVYEYQRGQKTVGGVGLVGPTVNALQIDLQDLPPGDIYALYAGIDSEHGEIYETPVDELSPDQADAWKNVSEALKGRITNGPNWCFGGISSASSLPSPRPISTAAMGC
ncbi:MAG: HEAT repeat domain-containing protein [Pirellulales bacterium]